MVFHAEGIACDATRVARVSRLPNHRFEKVVSPDFDIRWGCGASPSPHQDRFGRGFQKIVDDLIRSAGVIAAATGDGLRIAAKAIRGSAMKVGKKGVNDRGIRHAVQMHSTACVVVGAAMYPLDRERCGPPCLASVPETTSKHHLFPVSA